MVGLAILRVSDDEAVIDTFLMSCRVLDRKVEDIFLREIVRELKPRRILGHYVRTPKNACTADFYLQRGFFFLRNEPDGSWFVLEPDDQLSPMEGNKKK
jgi:predicted enzyme involved in methoxymalonyl-ACP biosynthesis